MWVEVELRILEPTDFGLGSEDLDDVGLGDFTKQPLGAAKDDSEQGGQFVDRASVDVKCRGRQLAHLRCSAG